MKVVLHGDYLVWECPASICGHVRIPVKGPKAWQWNGSLDKPTLNPSVKIDWTYGEGATLKVHCCHFFMRDGAIQFCSDSTHELAGKTVPMKEIEACQP